MPFKSFIQALAVSLALHAAAGVSISSSYFGSMTGPHPVMVTRRQLGNSDKKVEITLVAPQKVEEQKKILHKNRMKSGPPTTRLAANAADRRAIEQTSGGVRGSAELLADPQTGKVFSEYFVKIKEKIHETARNRYSSRGAVRGKATLFFILRSDGSLDSLSVSDANSDASSDAKKFALECVEKASPFPSFPKELDLKKISFSISVLFEDL